MIAGERGAALRACVALALAYLLVALGTIWLSRLPGNVATLWYANAMAAAVMLQQPVRHWAGLALAAAVGVVGANLAAGDALAHALGFAVPNVAEILLAAGLLRQAGLADSTLRSAVDMLKLLALGGLAAPLVGATLAASLMAEPLGVSFERLWVQWFNGSSVGAMGMLPLASLGLRRRHDARPRLPDNGRSGLVLLLLAAPALALLSLAHLPYPFVVIGLMPLLAAVWLEPLAVAAVGFGVSLAGAVAIATGVFVPRPFTRELEEALVYLSFSAALLPPLVLAGAMAAMRDSRDRLLARERELDHANRGLEQFVRMVSHDLREPLNTITQFGRLVDEDHGAAMPAQARHFVRLMNGGAARMRRLLDDVLHYARAQRGLTVDRHPVELDAVLHDALQGLQARIGASGARVQVAPLPVVPGQASLLQLLFQNLLSNALKFVAPGQVPEVEVSASVADGWVEVSVQDQGIGIAEADQARVFEPFQRVHLRRDYDGTGLGLALARQIAQAHGGDIRLRSAPGKGSCFTVRLPAG